jgi:hypothetical protein
VPMEYHHSSLGWLFIRFVISSSSIPLYHFE